MSIGVGAQLGPYEILQAIGSGGMGEVYRARDKRLQRTVAIKLLPRDRMADTERRRRFLVEAQAASALNHPKDGNCGLHVTRAGKRPAARSSNGYFLARRDALRDDHG